MGIFKSKEEKTVKANMKREKKLELVKKVYANTLLENEFIIDFLIGINENALLNSFIVLTNQRVVFKQGFTEKSIDINKITNIENKLVSIEIKGSNCDIVIKTVTFGDIVAMVKNINIQQSSSDCLTPNDNMGQLRKLKELYDEGIVTQEEFDLKKKQLLGI